MVASTSYYAVQQEQAMRQMYQQAQLDNQYLQNSPPMWAPNTLGGWQPGAIWTDDTTATTSTTTWNWAQMAPRQAPKKHLVFYRVNEPVIIEEGASMMSEPLDWLRRSVFKWLNGLPQ